MNLLVLAAFGLAIAHWAFIARIQGWGTVQSLFGLSQLLMLTGTLYLATEMDAPYTDVVAATTAIYFLGTLIWSLFRPPVAKATVDVPLTISRPTVGMITLLLLSLMITGLYYRWVGYSAFAVGLGDVLGNTDATDSVSELRLESYASGDYFAPGYVNQFKNVLGPAIGLLVLDYLFRIKHPTRWPTLLILCPVLAFGLLGTGQRAALAHFAVAAGLYYYLSRGRRLSLPVVGLGAVAVALFGLATVAIGRVGPSQSDAPWILNVGYQFWKRILLDNQMSGIIGGRYTALVPQEPLQGWFHALIDLLPGRSGNTAIDSDIAAFYRQGGTMPESLPGSAMTNLGYLGALIFFLFLAFLLGWVTSRALRVTTAAPLELMGIAGVFSTLGLWTAGTPVAPILSGLLTYAGLWWWGSRIREGSPAVRRSGEIAVPSSDSEVAAPTLMPSGKASPMGRGSQHSTMAATPTPTPTRSRSTYPARTAKT